MTKKKSICRNIEVSLVAALSITWLTACESEHRQFRSTEFDADAGRCYSMTPLLQTLPQTDTLGSFVEQSRNCTYDTVSVTYADEGAAEYPRLDISATVVNGKSPFVEYFTKDRDDEFLDTGLAQATITRANMGLVKQLESCRQHSVELGGVRSARKSSVMTHEAGKQICISTFASAGEIYSDLYIQPWPDILMRIRYTRWSEEHWHNNDVAQLMLPLVSELNISTENPPVTVEDSD